MTSVLQSALGGGRALLIGWFIPSLINIMMIGLLLVPGESGFRGVLGAEGESLQAAGFALVGTVILGTTLAALQVPLYRILEGYLGWPARLFTAGRDRHLSRKHLLEDRLEAVALIRLQEQGQLSADQAAALRAYSEHALLRTYLGPDASKGDVWLSLIEERLARFPRDDAQVVPTKLGNAIRRFEEFGFHRYGLDSQVMWNELNAAAPEPAREQAEAARIPVDFFVALLWGHLIFVAAGAISLGVGQVDDATLVWFAILAALSLSVLWYHVAVVATDEWAAAVRSLVGLGRKPLAEGFGFTLPDRHEAERDLRLSLARLSVGLGHVSDNAARLDGFRTPSQSQGAQRPASQLARPPGEDGRSGPRRRPH